MALVGSYDFQGVATDSSGSGNNGTVSGATYSTGRYGSALAFDGVNDNVNIGHASSINFILANPFTVAAWINPVLDLSESAVVGNTWAGPGWLFRVNTSNKLRFILVNTGGTTFRYRDSTAALTKNAWTHVAATWDGSSVINVYVNGVDVGATQVNTGSLTDITSTADVTIGDAVSAAPFKGNIDQVRIYNTALASGDILALYNESTVKTILPGPSIQTSQALTFNSNTSVPVLSTVTSAVFAADPFIYVNGGIGYLNSYADVASNGWQNSSYYKDSFGIVHVVVGAKSGTAASSMFQLPVGYRPIGSILAQCWIDSGTINWFSVGIDGYVAPLTGGTTSVIGVIEYVACL